MFIDVYIYLADSGSTQVATALDIAGQFATVTNQCLDTAKSLHWPTSVIERATINNIKSIFKQLGCSSERLMGHETR